MEKPGRTHGPAPWRTTGAAEPEHYARHLREADTGGRGGVFRHNRGLVITLIDLVVVSMLFVIFVVVIRPLSDRVTIGAYQAELAVEASDGDLYVRATVQQRSTLFGGTESPDGPFQPIVTMTALDAETADLAPPDGMQRTLELRIPEADDDEREQLTVTIRVGDEEAVHTVTIR